MRIYYAVEIEYIALYNYTIYMLDIHHVESFSWCPYVLFILQMTADRIVGSQPALPVAGEEKKKL